MGAPLPQWHFLAEIKLKIKAESLKRNKMCLITIFIEFSFDNFPLLNKL